MQKVKSFLASFVKNDVVVRATKTFVQTFLAVWALTNYEASKSAVIGAAAAGLSAVWNMVKEWSVTKE